MYSDLKNVQILLGLLKAYGIKKMVLSSGTTSIPVLHSVEEDDYFECYSVVDERSAAYFAVGMAQESHEPVVLVCTSGTAGCNYFPAVTEAYYQNVPIIIITCDKRPYELNHHILQKINQSNMYQDKSRFFTDIPFISGADSEGFCIDKINEAFIRCFIKEKGPVHLNIYTGGNRNFTVSKLPNSRRIWYYKNIDETCVQDIQSKLKKKKILIIAGQNTEYCERDTITINDFAKLFNCVVISDYMANLNVDKGIFPFRMLESMSLAYFEERIMPDVVISFGGNILSGKLNDFLLHTRNNYENWIISSNGELIDSWGHLTKWFDCDIFEFFKACCKASACDVDNSYYISWKEILEDTPVPEKVRFSHLYIAEKMAESIPEGAILHTGILNSTRVVQLYNFRKGITVYSNIGALGIDGSLSTFLGQAVATTRECFLLIGDLSFFYDMGAINIRYLKGNMHIILLNNGGGGEFYYNIGKKAIPVIDDYIAAAHSTKAETWVKERGFKYYSVHNEKEFDEAFADMMKLDSDVPQIIEAFTDKNYEANTIHQYYNDIAHRTDFDQKKQKIKSTLNKVFGPNAANKLPGRLKSN